MYICGVNKRVNIREFVATLGARAVMGDCSKMYICRPSKKSARTSILIIATLPPEQASKNDPENRAWARLEPESSKSFRPVWSMGQPTSTVPLRSEGPKYDLGGTSVSDAATFIFDQTYKNNPKTRLSAILETQKRFWAELVIWKVKIENWPYNVSVLKIWLKFRPPYLSPGS